MGNGKDAGRWKGGRRLNSDGYVMIFNSNYVHPSEKYLREHRIIMEKYLGRNLQSSEIVHHLNHDKADNRIENLVILARGDHPKVHNQKTGRWSRLYDQCIDCGTTEIHHEVGGRCYKCYYTFRNHSK